MDPPADADAEDIVSYQFYADSDLWERWKDTVPRSVALHDRLHELIAQDLEATRGGGYDDMEERSARLLATRIHHRAQTAEQALEQGDDEKVRKELANIDDIAGLFDD